MILVIALSQIDNSCLHETMDPLFKYEYQHDDIKKGTPYLLSEQCTEYCQSFTHKMLIVDREECPNHILHCNLSITTISYIDDKEEEVAIITDILDCLTNTKQQNTSANDSTENTLPVGGQKKNAPSNMPQAPNKQPETITICITIGVFLVSVATIYALHTLSDKDNNQIIKEHKDEQPKIYNKELYPSSVENYQLVEAY